MASIEPLRLFGRTRFAWFLLRTLAGLELPTVGIGKQALLYVGRIVTQGGG